MCLWRNTKKNKTKKQQKNKQNIFIRLPPLPTVVLHINLVFLLSIAMTHAFRKPPLSPVMIHSYKDICIIEVIHYCLETFLSKVVIHVYLDTYLNYNSESSLPRYLLIYS